MQFLQLKEYNKNYITNIRIHNKGVQHVYKYYWNKGIYKIRVHSNNSLIISTVGYQLNIDATINPVNMLVMIN